MPSHVLEVRKSLRMRQLVMKYSAPAYSAFGKELPEIGVCSVEAR